MVRPKILAIPYVHSLPEYLHLSGSPHGYALSIVVLTFFLRSTITLPFQLWARKRQARLQEEVMPRWNVLKGKEGLPLVKMKQARRQGKPFKVYKKELEEEVGARGGIQEASGLADRALALPLTASDQATIPDQGVRLAGYALARPTAVADIPSLSHPPAIAPNNGKRSFSPSRSPSPSSSPQPSPSDKVAYPPPPSSPKSSPGP